MKSIEEILKIKSPLIQAPMAGVQDSSLAMSVSETGALGSLPCAMLSREVLYSELKKIKESTRNPVNLNFFCHIMPEENKERQKAWQEVLNPYFKEFSVSPESGGGVSRMPFSEEHLEILEEFKPLVVSFHFGLPEKKLLNPLKEWGAKILSSATTMEEAVWLEKNGADIIIAQGVEAGGHRGMFLTKDISTQVSTMALVPQIVDAVSVPVVAAGGIADTRGIKAAKDLGASGVQIGTAYLLCKEAKTTALHRQALISEQARHTTLTNVFTGRPARGIVNRSMKELGFMNDKAPDFPYASAAMGQLRRAAEKENNSDFSPLWAGENTSGCREISAADLTLQWLKELNG